MPTFDDLVEVQPKTEIEDTKETTCLEAHHALDTTWIPIVDTTNGNLKMKVVTLDECSSEEFCSWVKTICPPMLQKVNNPQLFETYIQRKKYFADIIKWFANYYSQSFKL